MSFLVRAAWTPPYETNVKQGEQFAYNPATLTKTRLGFKYLEVFSEPGADITKFKPPEGFFLVEIKPVGKMKSFWVYRAKLKPMGKDVNRPSI